MHEGLVAEARESSAPRLPCAGASGDAWLETAAGPGMRMANSSFTTDLTNLDTVLTFIVFLRISKIIGLCCGTSK